MQQYNTFIFESYSFDEKEGRIELNYSLDDEVQFTETVTVSTDEITTYDEHALDRALFALHLIGGISYYKTCLPQEIEVRSGALDEKQAEFWNTVYTKGLGEFFYKNDIDFADLINFPHTIESSLPEPEKNTKPLQKILLPIGGGKDSIVSAELLKQEEVDITLFRMNAHPLIEQQAEIARLPLLTVERTLSPALFKLNDDGALNGHIPITAYMSCLTVVTSILYGFDAIAMSNERSANEGNIEFKGMEVNHQWSKGYEFEQLFQRYIAQYISPDIRYFSVLRGFSELTIAKLFSQYPEYFSVSTSCNANWAIAKEKPTNLWSSEDPKSLFVFALLAAFLPEDVLTDIFDAQYFADETTLPLYKELLGLEGNKPFECVGTPEETKAAFLLAREQGDYDNYPVIKMFIEEVVPSIEDAGALIDTVLTPSDEHSIPADFL